LSSQFFAAKSGDSPEDWLSVKNHLIDTMGVIADLCGNESFVSESVCRAAGYSREEFRTLAVFYAGVHDIGKCSAIFQMRISRAIADQLMRLESLGIQAITPSPDKNNNYSHPLVGAAILLQKGFSEKSAEIIASHHGLSVGGVSYKKFLTNRNAKIQIYGGTPEPYEAAWDEIISEALERCGSDKDGINLLESRLSVDSQIIFTGLLIVADWIASNTYFFPLIGSGENSEQRTRKGMARVRLPEGWEPEFRIMDDMDFSERFGFTPNGFQHQILSLINAEEQRMSGVGMVIAETPTGSGKTETALALAEILAKEHGCSGIFFGLPTQSSADGLFHRIHSWINSLNDSDIAEQISVRLAHGNAQFNQEYQKMFSLAVSPDENSEVSEAAVVNTWLAGRHRSLLSNVVIGTVDQALMACLNTRYLQLRHFGLAGKVVIIDEVHSYDAYTSTFLQTLLAWLGKYGVPVILLSATLTSESRRILLGKYLNKEDSAVSLPAEDISYPSLTWTGNSEFHYRHLISDPKDRKTVSISLADESDFSVLLGRLAESRGCVGVIVNTVRRAVEIYRRLAESGSNKVFLLHSRFLPEDRAKIEQQITAHVGKNSSSAERTGCIVIGTQVLEQSLDLDFDVMISDLCPMDMLLQRIGRLHRHRRPASERPAALVEPKCYVIDTSEHNRIYAPFVISATLEQLRKTSLVTVPDDVSGLLEKTYNNNDEQFRIEKESYLQQRKDSENKAELFKIADPECCVFKGMVKTPDLKEENEAEASVRDIHSGLRVLLLRRSSENRITTMDGKFGECADREPDYDTCHEFLKQSINLPQVKYGDCSDYLKAIRETVLKEWDCSPCLRNEIIVLADENSCFTVGEKSFTYDQKLGLIQN